MKQNRETQVPEKLGDVLDEVADAEERSAETLHRAAERARTLETIVRARSPKIDKLEHRIEDLEGAKNK